MRRTSQKWYNMQYINMSGNLPMGIAENLPHVRYSAAYPTGAERIARTPLPWGLTPLYQQIDMSNGKPMGIAAKEPQARYSAAYPTRAERGLRRGNYCVTLTVSEGSDPKNTL